MFGFVDDVLGGSRTFEETKRLSDIVKKELFHSGFINNDNKSLWEPRQEGEHSGFYVNFKDGTLSLPFFPPKKKQQRIEKFGVLLYFIMESLYSIARMVARLIGAVI